MTTKNLPHPTPPKFEYQYQWENDHTLLITYKSKRNLNDIVMSHIKAVAKHYNEKINLQKIQDNVICVEFLK